MANVMLHENICRHCLETLLWNWGHGMSNKVLAIKGEIAMLRTELGKPRCCRKNIELSLNTIEEIAEEISELPSPFQIELVPINSLIKERVKTIEKRQSFLATSFTMNLADGSPVVQANKIWLRRLLDIMIDNAIEAMGKSFENEIEIATLWGEKEVVIAVRDTGEGIIKQVLDSLFDNPHTPQAGGRGRGLFVAQFLANLYGGKIEITDTNTSGTTIIIRLPLG